MKFLILAFVLAFCAVDSFASTNRVLDGATITNGAAVLTLPTTTDNIPGDATADTFTNKSISGATNTLSAIPASAISSGTLGVANGGTGASTLTSGSVIIGNGTSAPTFVAPGTAGNVLTSSGGVWASVAGTATNPNVTGTAASPTAITAAGGVTFSGSNYNNIAFISATSPITVTASLQIAAGTAVGQKLELISESASNTVKFQDGTGLSLNGAWIGGLQSHLLLVWDGTVWTESARR